MPVIFVGRGDLTASRDGVHGEIEDDRAGFEWSGADQSGGENTALGGILCVINEEGITC